MAGRIKGPERSAPAFPRGTLVQAAVIGAAFVALFWHFFANQARFSLDPDWSHAYLVPLIAAYYIYENRRRILTIPAKANWLGLPVMIAGIVIYGAFTFVDSLVNHAGQGLGVLVCLFGMVLFTLGARLWRALWFPQAYLALGIRVPPPLLLLVTPTLQRWAAVGSYFLLNVVGIDTEISGTVLSIHQGGQTIPLNVAEACSGMRMIVAFIALGVAVAFLSCRWWWQRVVMVVMAVPVAMLVNVLRVATIGFMSTIDPSWSQGDAHMALGLVWLLPAVLLYLGLAWILDRIVIMDEGQEEAKDASGAAIPIAAVTAAAEARRGGGAAFAVVVGLLVTSIGVFAVAKTALDVVLRKEPVALRHPLSDVPRVVGKWKRVGKDDVFSGEVVEELGTDLYLSRRYALEGDERGGVLELHLAYYTGIIDAVPHVPEVCYVGAGWQRTPTAKIVEAPIDMSGWYDDPKAVKSGDEAELPWRMARTWIGEPVRMPRLAKGEALRMNVSEFWQPDQPDRRFVAGYFFIANGGATPLGERVRLLAFKLRDRHAYYCKVQLSYRRGDQSTTAEELAAISGEFLTVMLPEIMHCLPDWREVVEGRAGQGEGGNGIEGG